MIFDLTEDALNLELLSKEDQSISWEGTNPKTEADGDGRSPKSATTSRNTNGPNRPADHPRWKLFSIVMAGGVIALAGLMIILHVTGVLDAAFEYGNMATALGSRNPIWNFFARCYKIRGARRGSSAYVSLPVLLQSNMDMDVYENPTLRRFVRVGDAVNRIKSLSKLNIGGYVYGLQSVHSYSHGLILKLSDGHHLCVYGLVAHQDNEQHCTLVPQVINLQTNEIWEESSLASFFNSTDATYLHDYAGS